MEEKVESEDCGLLEESNVVAMIRLGRIRWTGDVTIMIRVKSIWKQKKASSRLYLECAMFVWEGCVHNARFLGQMWNCRGAAVDRDASRSLITDDPQTACSRPIPVVLHLNYMAIQFEFVPFE